MQSYCIGTNSVRYQYLGKGGCCIGLIIPWPCITVACSNESIGHCTITDGEMQSYCIGTNSVRYQYLGNRGCCIGLIIPWPCITVTCSNESIGHCTITDC